MSEQLAIIIRALNEEAHIGRLLTGIERQTRRPSSVIVVDSGSTDATRSIASAFGAEIVPVAAEMFSFGHALNVGIAHADADVVVLASAHVYPVYDTWLEHLTGPFEDPRVALSYGRQVVPPDGRFSEGRLLEQWFPPESVRRQRHPFCNNANAAIRRAVWRDGPYDEALTGLEDLDWAKRALEAGHLLSYVAEAPVVHVHDESFEQVVNRYRREAIAHKAIYHEQRMAASTAARLAFANILEDLRAAREAGVMPEEAWDIARFRVAQFLGTYRGFAQSGPVTELLKRRFYFPSSEAGSGAASNEIGRPINYEEPVG